MTLLRTLVDMANERMMALVAALVVIALVMYMYNNRLHGADETLWTRGPFTGMLEQDRVTQLPGQKVTATQALIPGDENFRPLKPGALNEYDEDPAFKYPRNIVQTSDLVRVGDPDSAPKTILGVGVPGNDTFETNMLGVSTDRVNAFKVNPFKDYGAIDLGLSSVAILDAAADYDVIVSNTRYQKIFGGVSDLRAPPIVDPNPADIPVGGSPGPSFFFPSPDYFAMRTHVV